MKGTNIAIIGASGFLGTQLTHHLLVSTNFHIRAISRNATRMTVEQQYKDRLLRIDADVMDEDEMTIALNGVTTAYYFVHMMGQKNKDFYTQEAIAAHRFSAAAIAAGVERVIFMGGLGNDHEDLSPHLLSRHNNGTILRENLPLVLEFRASMIIGNGSIAFDIVRNLVHKMPVMTLPRWSITNTQPIALADALQYLTQAVTVPLTQHRIVEIGGPEVLSYMQFYKKYAQWSGKHPFIVRVPFLPEWLGGCWLDLFTPKNHAKIGKVMLHSMSNAMIVTHDHALQLFPTIHPRSIEKAFDEAHRAEEVTSAL
ncbi:NAD(P)H-binding protein [Candidatus Saccharibacteria bacterium]|nr:NAD(P)H-binding protein [Candidatus Saccharibacteria bacterium]